MKTTMKSRAEMEQQIIDSVYCFENTGEIEIRDWGHATLLQYHKRYGWPPEFLRRLAHAMEDAKHTLKERISYADPSLTTSELARMYKVSPKAVRRHRRAFGEPRRPPGRPKKAN